MITAILVTPDNFEQINRERVVEPHASNVPTWHFYDSDDDELLVCIMPGDLASTPEQAIAVHTHINFCEIAAFRAGEHAGRERTRDKLRELLGITSIEEAFFSLLAQEVQP